tara:strand:+ start:130 stop:657 length:528 start_codon:yes stop_codon:yes gene_type:complete
MPSGKGTYGSQVGRPKKMMYGGLVKGGVKLAKNLMQKNSKKIIDKEKAKDLLKVKDPKQNLMGKDIAKQNNQTDKKVLDSFKNNVPKIGQDVVGKMYGGAVKKKMYGGKVKKMEMGGKAGCPMKMRGGGIVEEIKRSPNAAMVSDSLKRMAGMAGKMDAPVQSGMRRQRPQKEIM